MKSKIFFAALTLIGLLMELPDPSTNFIRMNILSTPEIGLRQRVDDGFQVHLADSQDNGGGEEQAGDSGPHHHDQTKVYSSYPATNFVFDVAVEKYAPPISNIEELTDQYSPPFFKPPRQS